MMFDENGVTKTLTIVSDAAERRQAEKLDRFAIACTETVARVVYPRFFSDWKKPLTGRLNKSPGAAHAIANRHESPKSRSEPAQLKRARRVPVITLSSNVDGRRLGRRDGAEVAIGGRPNGVISRW